MSDERKTEEVVRELSQEADRPMEVELHDDRMRTFSSTSLSRMSRGERDPGLRQSLDDLNTLADDQIMRLFGSAYQIMNDLYDIVRVPQCHPDTGEVLTDRYGWKLWEVNESGYPIEDWSALGHKERGDFLFRITTNLFAWEQAAARLWSDSMYAKAVWEEALANGYEDSRSNGGKTVEDRTQAARLASRMQRLEGIFHASLSRRADALVRSMTLLSQRLKDVLSA